MTDKKKRQCKTDTSAKNGNCPALQRSDAEIEAENNYIVSAA